MLHEIVGRCRQSVDCARGAECEFAGLCNVSRMTVEPQVGINGHAKRLELRCNWQSAPSNVDGGDIGS